MERDTGHDLGVEGRGRRPTDHECCAFHRNVEISSRYAWIYRAPADLFKWAGMAAIASHHVRLALFPLRLDTDRTGYVDIPHSLRSPAMLLMEDVNTIRSTNNAIFDDIFWVHFAYVSADNGIERLRALLRAERQYAPILVRLRGDRPGTPRLGGRGQRPRRLDGAPKTSSGRAMSSSWNTSSAPWCNRTSITSRARSPGSISIGSATTFEVRGIRRDVAYFTSFYLSSLPRGSPTLRGERGRGSPASMTAGVGS